MSTEHTPGPWFWEFLDNGRAMLTHKHPSTGEFDLGGGLVARDMGTSETILYHKGGDNCWWFEDGPNARLIAAAPELLDALRQAQHEIEWITAQTDNGRLDAVERMHRDGSLQETISAAIAKAEGRG